MKLQLSHLILEIIYLPSVITCQIEIDLNLLAYCEIKNTPEAI